MDKDEWFFFLVWRDLIALCFYTKYGEIVFPNIIFYVCYLVSSDSLSRYSSLCQPQMHILINSTNYVHLVEVVQVSKQIEFLCS